MKGSQYIRSINQTSSPKTQLCVFSSPWFNDVLGIPCRMPVSTNTIIVPDPWLMIQVLLLTRQRSFRGEVGCHEIYIRILRKTTTRAQMGTKLGSQRLELHLRCF